MFRRFCVYTQRNFWYNGDYKSYVLNIGRLTDSRGKDEIKICQEVYWKKER